MSNSQRLARQQLSQSTRRQRPYNCVTDARWNGNSALSQNVFAFPPTWYKFPFEATQAFEIIEGAELSRRHPQAPLNDTMLADQHILGTLVRQRRCAQRRKRSSFLLQLRQRFDD